MERIVLAPGANQTELLRSLAKQGYKDTFGLRIMSAKDLAILALERNGKSFEKELIPDFDAGLIFYNILKNIDFNGEKYFVLGCASSTGNMSSLIKDEDENRIYYDNFLDIKDCIYNNLHSISMFYIVFYEYLQYTFKEVCWVFWDCDLTLTRRGINKAKILESLKSYSRIFVYWNWVNDLSLFYNKKRRKFNIWVWNNQEILQLSDVKLKSYVELEEYLMSKVFMDL